MGVSLPVEYWIDFEVFVKYNIFIGVDFGRTNLSLISFFVVSK